MPGKTADGEVTAPNYQHLLTQVESPAIFGGSWWTSHNILVQTRESVGGFHCCLKIDSNCYTQDLVEIAEYLLALSKCKVVSQ